MRWLCVSNAPIITGNIGDLPGFAYRVQRSLGVHVLPEMNFMAFPVENIVPDAL